MSLELSNDKQEMHENNNNIEITGPDDLLKNGIDIIYQSFSTNNNNYIEKINELKKTIIDLNKKLEIMKEELDMIQRENQYYKNQNKKLKNEVENMNKVVNNIKGKLINCDFNLNSKKIIENLNQENYENNDSISQVYKNNRKNQCTTFRNVIHNFENENNTINNYNYDTNYFFYRNQIKNNELKRNSNTIRYENKNSNLNDILLENDINNMNNYFNINNRQLHTLYSDLNIKNKSRFRNKNFNEENSKNNTYQKYTKSSKVSLTNKKNINFNSNKNINTYRRKNKTRNISFSNHIQKGKLQKSIKYIMNNNNEKNESNDKEYIDLNLGPFLEDLDNFDYNKKICQTFQNSKNCTKCINELKLKEIEFFLEKCKIYLENKDFENIAQLYKKYKDDMIKNIDIISQIKFFLKDNKELLNLFNNIIL